MYSKIAPAALLGLSALASAAPYQRGPFNDGRYPSSSISSSYQTSTSTIASDSTQATGYGVSNSQGEKPFVFQNESDVFPNIDAANPQDPGLLKINDAAGGNLPNASAPKTPNLTSAGRLGFIAFNELFEVAFFTELLGNLTSNVPGYAPADVEKLLPGANPAAVIATIKAVQAQEELHELNANGAFKKITGQTIEPCEYIFPVDNIKDALALASKFTDVVLSTLPDIQNTFATDGDADLVRGIGAVIGQEGEQDGFYRSLLGDVPSQLPFLTQGAVPFAFNAIIQNFVVPESCPSFDLLKEDAQLVEFGTLTLMTDASKLSNQEDIQIQFEVSTDKVAAQSPVHTDSLFTATQGQFITYLNQADIPVTVPILKTENGEGNFNVITVDFPGKTHNLDGLTIVALTNTNGDTATGFSSPDAVADATLNGPELIEVNALKLY